MNFWILGSLLDSGILNAYSRSKSQEGLRLDWSVKRRECQQKHFQRRQLYQAARKKISLWVKVSISPNCNVKSLSVDFKHPFVLVPTLRWKWSLQKCQSPVLIRCISSLTMNETHRLLFWTWQTVIWMRTLLPIFYNVLERQDCPLRWIYSVTTFRQMVSTNYCRIW